MVIQGQVRQKIRLVLGFRGDLWADFLMELVIDESEGFEGLDRQIENGSIRMNKTCWGGKGKGREMWINEWG